MKIFDVFPLGYETDVLLIRLRTLAEIVDEFVIVEGDITFSGKRRDPLWPRLAVTDDFAEFEQRVTWVHRTLTEHESWKREHELRGAMLETADSIGCGKRDGVIISDADEIPNPEAIRRWQRGTRNPQKLPGYYHQLRLDLRAVGSLEGDCGRPGHLWEWRQPLIGERMAFQHAQTDRAMMSGRVRRCEPDVYGWHLTCQGTPGDIVAKLQAYSHEEHAGHTEDHIRTLIETRSALAHGVDLERVPLHALPPPVVADPEPFVHLFTDEGASDAGTIAGAR